MNQINLPTFEDVIRFVESSEEFKQKLDQVAKITTEDQKEAGLEMRVDLYDTDNWSLSEVVAGSEGSFDMISPPLYEDHVIALGIHSHPGYATRKLVCFSSGDHIHDYTIFSANIAALTKHLIGEYMYLDLYRATEFARRHINWMHTSAIVGMEEDNGLVMLLYQPPHLFEFRGTQNKIELTSQDVAIEGMKAAGYIVRLLRFAKNKAGVYEPIEKR
ncbi:hypothetical protein HYX06_01475 [Candidatus Woesearchaeota archaeon]|nr:hypothetical protein [Candidatus Woesearchaeota archaeon]